MCLGLFGFVLDVFGCVWVCLGLVACVGICVCPFGCVWVRLDLFGPFGFVWI